MHLSIVLPAESVGFGRWHAALLVALTVAVVGCGAGNEGQTRRSEDPDEQMQEAAEGALEFRLEHHLDYRMEWLLMDGAEKMFYQGRVDAGEAAPFEREPTEFAYLLRLTLLEVYPGTRYADTVITEIGNGLP